MIDDMGLTYSFIFPHVQNRYLKQRKDKTDIIHSIETTTILHTKSVATGPNAKTEDKKQPFALFERSVERK